MRVSYERAVSSNVFVIQAESIIGKVFGRHITEKKQKFVSKIRKKPEKLGKRTTRL